MKIEVMNKDGLLY